MSETPITYYSTNGNTTPVFFPAALLKGLAPDKGLYMPSGIPVFSEDELAELRGMDYYRIALNILNKYLSPHIPEKELEQLCKQAYSFPVPLEKVKDRSYIMRLDQGPTASFKDFAARMMARLMNWFLVREGQRLIILTATSGDTGSAVANAFYGLENIDVVVLFPRDEVTGVQRRQMTTLEKNIHIIALDGKFDHCQALVKQAFVDPALAHLPLSSANSINIGRLLPQSVFYFYAWASLSTNAKEKIIFSVPSGNFGNLMGGLLARQMGLPVERFIIATNANKEVPEYLNQGVYSLIEPSISCISSAMNVGHPSNMSRIISLYGGSMDEKGRILKEPDLARMRKDLWGTSVSDEETSECIRVVWKHFKLMLEPHGAVAWTGLERFMAENQDMQSHLSVSLETAHPAKFPEQIVQVIGNTPPLPESLEGLSEKPEKYASMPFDYTPLKQYLLGIFP